MCNLVYHREDFQLEAEWHFFATPHGKNACHGIGGTVKRETGNASLKAITPANPSLRAVYRIKLRAQLYLEVAVLKWGNMLEEGGLIAWTTNDSASIIVQCALDYPNPD